MSDKMEDHNKHWHEKDDLNAARGIFGWPLIGSIVFIVVIIVLFL